MDLKTNSKFNFDLQRFSLVANPYTINPAIKDYKSNASIGYLITINQVANQTITVNCNGVNHTSSFVAPPNSNITITIKPDVWFSAGNIILNNENTNSNTTFTTTANKAITISATTALKKTDYEFNCTFVKDTNTNRSLWGKTGQWYGWDKGVYGNISQVGNDNLDAICYCDATDGSYLGTVCWVGSNSVAGLFNYMSMDVIKDGVTYSLVKEVPNSDFQSAGDIWYYDKNDTSIFNWKVIHDNLNANLTLHMYIS